jgi:hypothetical protein
MIKYIIITIICLYCNVSFGWCEAYINYKWIKYDFCSESKSAYGNIKSKEYLGASTRHAGCGLHPNGRSWYVECHRKELLHFWIKVYCEECKNSYGYKHKDEFPYFCEHY